MKTQIKLIIIFILAAFASNGQTNEDSLIHAFPNGDTVISKEPDTLVKGQLITDTLKKPSLIPDNCAICSGHVHTTVYAPYYTKFKEQFPFIIGSSAIFAGGLILSSVNKHPALTEDQVKHLDKNSINSFDRISTGYYSPAIANASDYVLIGITVLPALFISEHHTRHDIYPLIVMAAESYLFNYGLTLICKNLTVRTRPYAYNTNVSLTARTGTAARESFFSGHTSQTASATFLFANVISDYHPNLKRGFKVGMWAFAAIVPAVEGYMRMRAGKHYPTDVIFGYAVGAVSGWIIPRLHRYQKTHYKYDLGLMPYKEGMMMSFNYRFK